MTRWASQEKVPRAECQMMDDFVTTQRARRSRRLVFATCAEADWLALALGQRVTWMSHRMISYIGWTRTYRWSIVERGIWCEASMF